MFLYFFECLIWLRKFKLSVDQYINTRDRLKYYN